MNQIENEMRIEDLEEVLRWYADPENWVEWASAGCGGTDYRYEWRGSWDDAPLSMSSTTPWLRAREVLEK